MTHKQVISTSNSKETLGFSYLIKKAGANSTRPNYGLSEAYVSAAICSSSFPHVYECIFDVASNTTPVSELLKRKRQQSCPVGFAEHKEWIGYWQAEMLLSIFTLGNVFPKHIPNKNVETYRTMAQLSDSLVHWHGPASWLLTMDTAKCLLLALPFLLPEQRALGHSYITSCLWWHITLWLLAGMEDPWGIFSYCVS